MRWRPYNGVRIERAGFRTSVTYSHKVRFAPEIRVYGCVWPSEDGWCGYFERLHPGEIEDVMLGFFPDQRSARRAVVAALNDPENKPADAW